MPVTGIASLCTKPSPHITALALANVIVEKHLGHISFAKALKSLMNELVGLVEVKATNTSRPSFPASIYYLSSRLQQE
jgi:hypothetical protein